MEEEKKEMTFSELINTIAEGKGISRDSVLAALKEAMETSYIKFLKGGDDAIVEARIIEEEDGTFTAINGVAAEADAAVAGEGWYTISGVKLNAQPTEKGIYIFNGKKVAIQ